MPVFDLETHLIQPGCTFPPIVCGAIEQKSAGPNGGHVALVGRGTTLEWVSACLARGAPLVGHWIAFDLGCIVAAEPSLAQAVFAHYRAGLVECTQIRSWLIDAAHGALGKLGGYSLSRLHERAFGTALDKGEDTWRLRYRELDGIPIEQWPEAARTYPISDVQATRRLHDFQEKWRDLYDDQHRQAGSAFALALTAGWGLVTDPCKVDAFEMRYRAELADIDAQVQAAGIIRANGSQDMKRTHALVSAAYGGSPPTTDKGGVKADKITLAENPAQDPILIALSRRKPVQSQLSRGLPILREGIVHTKYGFAASGRTTSGNGGTVNKDDGEDADNVQNLDADSGIRECFVPRPGYVFGSCDFAALELCTFAQIELDLFQSSELANAINRGEDPHSSFAAVMLDIPYDEAIKRHRDLDEAFEKTRDVCKIGNFGFLGGLGAASFVSYAFRKSNGKVRLTEDQARDFKRGWLRRWQTSRYFEHIATIADGSGMFRHHRSNRWRGRLGFTDACNTPFQGLGSDAARAAHFAVVEATFTPGTALWGSHVVNFVHDSIDSEVPEYKAHEAVTLQSEIMVREARVWIPDVKVKAEPLLARYMSKKAKPVRDGAGRLIPWQ